MERWKPQEEKIEKCQGWIGELEEEIKLEREKVPNMQEWEKMSWEDKEKWAKQASDEQLKKIQHEGLNF